MGNFNVAIWTGDGAARNIVTGNDNITDGALVLIKQRQPAIATDYDWHFFDTFRGSTVYSKVLSTDNFESSDANSLTSFNADGFSLGSYVDVNESGADYVGFTFQEVPGLLDIVTYLGNGVAGLTVAHSLGSAPGMILVKRRIADSDWRVQHISRGGTKGIILNQTTGETTDSTLWDNTAADASNLTLGSHTDVNANGVAYIAYVFAHDPSAGGEMQCGQYTGDGLAIGPSINLGWQPEFVMIKPVTGTGHWLIMDTTRGIRSPGNDDYLVMTDANELVDTRGQIDLTATGFDVVDVFGASNDAGVDYIYMAVRNAVAGPSHDGTIAVTLEDSEMAAQGYLQIEGTLDGNVQDTVAAIVGIVGDPLAPEPTELALTPIDHKLLALSRLVTQFKESTNLQNYICALLSEANVLEQVFQDLLELRYLDTATGAQLDVVGEIVGQSRELVDAEIFEYFGFATHAQAQSYGSIFNPALGGRFVSVGEPTTGFRLLSDDEYRLYIRARIARNSTQSTPEQIISQLQFLFDTPQILLSDGDTFYEISIGRKLSLNEKAILLNTDLIPKTAGVGASYVSEYDYNNFFSFQGVPNGKGYGSVSNPFTGGMFGNLI